MWYNLNRWWIMELFTAAPMLLGTKALLKALQIPYIEKTAPENAPDDKLLEIDWEGSALTLLPRSNRQLFHHMVKGQGNPVPFWRWLRAYQTAQDYMTQLDRWKDFKDRLDPQTQQAEIVRYLDQHLDATFWRRAPIISAVRLSGSIWPKQKY